MHRLVFFVATVAGCSSTVSGVATDAGSDSSPDAGSSGAHMNAGSAGEGVGGSGGLGALGGAAGTVPGPGGAGGTASGGTGATGATGGVSSGGATSTGGTGGASGVGSGGTAGSGCHGACPTYCSAGNCPSQYGYPPCCFSDFGKAVKNICAANPIDGACVGCGVYYNDDCVTPYELPYPEPPANANVCNDHDDCFGHICNLDFHRCQWPCEGDRDCLPTYMCAAPACVPR